MSPHVFPQKIDMYDPLELFWKGTTGVCFLTCSIPPVSRCPRGRIGPTAPGPSAHHPDHPQDIIQTYVRTYVENSKNTDIYSDCKTSRWPWSSWFYSRPFANWYRYRCSCPRETLGCAFLTSCLHTLTTLSGGWNFLSGEQRCTLNF